MTTKARKEVFYAPGAHVHTSPIPEGVKAGGFIFLSAIRGVPPGGQRVDIDNVEEEARYMFENVKNTLAVAGATMEDVVKIAVYMTDLNDRGALNKVWKEYFPENPPARFAVQVLGMGPPDDKSRLLVDVTALAP
jgi:enamine deaminase RidA (YjgF/YER057c/UK114 family)